MEPIYIQWTDEAETTIQSYFGSPQDDEVWPNQGIVYADDPRWKVFYDLNPPWIQQLFPTPTTDD